MNKVLHIPFELRGISNIAEVIYKSNESASESGFDILNVPFDPNLCIGYPVLHAYIKDMAATGYRRYCGWIQLVKREYFSSTALAKPDENIVCIDTNDPASIYLAYGSPAEIYDAPCYNLNGNVKGIWTAYTYLVDMPSRMNGNTMIFLAGFQWGYEEEMKDENLLVQIQDIKILDIMQWREHIPNMKAEYPQYNYKK
jgi:hypothetical protein